MIESLYDGTLDLLRVDEMNEAIDVLDYNSYLAHEHLRNEPSR